MKTPNLSSIVKQDVLAELKKGNTDILKGLPPVISMQYALALQNEAGDYKEKSLIDGNEVNKAMLDRLKDSGVKERLTKEIEQEENERAEKVALAKQITKEITGE